MRQAYSATLESASRDQKSGMTSVLAKGAAPPRLGRRYTLEGNFSAQSPNSLGPLGGY
jgi:hypothetical protein